jgi:type VI secretion system secreted protein VgrG
MYDYPGGYAYHFSGIDRAGGEQAGELQKIFEESRHLIEVRRQEIDVNYNVIEGESDCASFIPGYRFKLFNHPNSECNRRYALTSVTHEALQSPSYTSNEETARNYHNTFTCRPYGDGSTPYRPPRITPKPVVQGSQTAVVVGPSNEEIFTDKYGRVKVQFHWDRQGNMKDSSCWLRVAQNQAGLHWGAIYIPRIGQEVVVAFLEGNPDRPLIIGSVYNAKELPPYNLPAEKSKTVIFKSSTYKGGSGFNEMRIEDRKGEEQIFIHAERNKDIRIKNDRFETVNRNAHFIVGNNQIEEVLGDKHLSVKGARVEKVSGTISRTAGADIQERAGMKYALKADSEIHLKSGMNLVIESGTSLTLKVGGNFININSSGIYLSGSMIFLNSGGAAGTGAGSSPESPKKPIEADRATGGGVSKTKAKPPTKPTKYSPAALVMKQAAKKGMPFCEVCSKQANRS